MRVIVCKPKSLPIEKQEAATRRAIEINPDNARHERRIARIVGGRRGGERRIAVVVARRWPASGVHLSASFLDNPSPQLRTRILRHMNAWGEAANVVFSETKGIGQVRIARFDSPDDMSGYWSYVGTEILEIAEDQPTLNLDSFTMKTAESEYRRVVRHEAGHTLGFDHEHMRSDIVARIDRARAIKYFFKSDGWTPEEVDEQVLTPLSKKSILGTKESDPVSIMCYDLPGSIMKDRKPVPGGVDINPRDYAFAAALYPKDRLPLPAPARAQASEPVPAPAPVVVPITAQPDSEERDTFHIILLDEFRPENSGKAVTTPKWAQVLATYGGARVSSAMRLRADKGEPVTRFGRIIAMHERIKQYTNRASGTLPGDGAMLDFGSDLFESLVQGDVRRLYDEARARQRKGRLDLVLTSMIPWISEKPWEFAYDRGRGTFLATEDLHFVRNVLTNMPADAIVRPDGALRILVAAAQPVGFGRLSIDQEIEVIRRGFQPLIDAKLAVVDVMAQVTPQRLHEQLSTSTPYQIVHFIGHGVYNDEQRQGCLVFVNERGGEYTLGEREIREIFCRRGLSLVFLNACESGRGGRADFNKGVAQSLVAHGLPALVANQYSVLDSSATSFAQHFYWSLAQGLSIGQSAREARIAVNYGINGEPIDWAVPVVYARDPSMTLCRPSAAATALASSTGAAAAHAAAPQRGNRVGVWDVDDVFPALEKTLADLTAAQALFGFELVDTSVPLDVWDVDKEEGVSFLRADLLADRLRRKAGELAVDLLVCVTRHWLRDSEWLYLYGWWPDDGNPPVIVFSVAGLEELKPEGPETDRAIANALVAGFAGFYGRTGTHRSGARDCPLYFNEQRALEHMVGAQRFDATCRRRLAKALGSKLPALEALLTAFAP